MGLKLSKLVKRSYVVSEGVQTDLSIESCEEIFDSKSFITPPRDVQHLCDPRSISKGIARTPIMCKIHEVISPSQSSPKPYLETNLDDVLLPYHPPNPCDHLMETERPASVNGIYTELNEQSSSSTHILTFKSEESLISQSCNIEIGEIDEIINRSESYSCDIDINSLTMNDVKEFKVDLMTTEESSVFEPFVKVIEKNRPLNCPVLIDSSETVEQMCQQILDELLESKDDIYEPGLNERDEDLFPDEHGSDSESSCHEPTADYKVNPITPVLSELVSKPIEKVIPNNNEGQFWNASPLKRMPFGEVGNIQQIRQTLGSTKLQSEINNSPLKSMLPILPSLSTNLPSKLHRSKWDTENTLII